MGGARGGEVGGAKGGASVINDCDKNGTEEETTTEHWKPLLLIIPLRLGLTEINSVYTESLKVNAHLVNVF